MATITATGQLPTKITNMSKLDTTLLHLCKDTYEISYNELEDSINEGRCMLDYYHNDQWTNNQLRVLTSRGQPAETFNVVKMLTHAMVGYFDTVANQISIEPRHMNSSTSAMIVNDAVQYIQDTNDYETLRRKLQIDSLLTGLCVTYETVVDTGKTDNYGRPIYDISIERVPSWQVRIDPMSKRDDYEDARYIHRYKWLPEEEVIRLWGKAKLEEITAYYNALDGDTTADWWEEYSSEAVGKYRQWNNYQVVHSVVKYKNKIYECLWSGETLLEKKVVSFKKVPFPYRPIKLFEPVKAGYYGAFREIAETQLAINQAIIQIQQLINTSKAFVEKSAVENLDDFKKTFNTVNAVVTVTDLDGIRVEDMSKDIAAQYSIINEALTRIKSVLGINDSFLGQAFASDSGRKVGMQKQSSASQLSVLTDRVKYQHKMVGWDIVNLIQQYWTAERLIAVSDPVNGLRYAMVNKPLLMPNGEIDPKTGQPKMTPIFEPEEDPATGKYLKDKDGAIILTPLNDPDTDVKYAEVQLKVIATNTNNAEERNQLLLETVVNGPIGQALLQMNPAGYMQTAAMMIQESGTKNSPAIAKILNTTAAMVSKGQIDPTLAMSGGDASAIMGAALGGSNGGSNAVQGKKSQQLQVPTRFNNGETNV